MGSQSTCCEYSEYFGARHLCAQVARLDALTEWREKALLVRKEGYSGTDAYCGRAGGRKAA
jgi:hypothetical protein